MAVNSDLELEKLLLSERNQLYGGVSLSNLPKHNTRHSTAGV